MEEEIVVNGRTIYISTLDIHRVYPPDALREKVRIEIVVLKHLNTQILKEKKGHLMVEFLFWLITRGEDILCNENSLDEHKAYTVLKYGQIITDAVTSVSPCP